MVFFLAFRTTNQPTNGNESMFVISMRLFVPPMLRKSEVTIDVNAWLHVVHAVLNTCPQEMLIIRDWHGWINVGAVHNQPSVVRERWLLHNIQDIN